MILGYGSPIPFQGMAGMEEGETQSGVELRDIANNIKDLVTLYNQQQILNANIDRAKQGLPPINTAQIAPTYNVGLAPDTKNMLIIGGIALIAVLLLTKGR